MPQTMTGVSFYYMLDATKNKRDFIKNSRSHFQETKTEFPLE